MADPRSSATLVRVADAKPHVWLLEWHRARTVRSVALAVDTSDSCWQVEAPTRDAGQVDRLFQTLALSMAAGDRCSLWILGEVEPRDCVELVGESRERRDDFCRALQCALRPTRGGSWIKPTWSAIQRSCRRDAREGLRPFMLIATDGEIFDLEAVEKADFPESQAALVRIGAGPVPAACSLLERWARPLEPTVDAMKEFLALSDQSVRLEIAEHDLRRVEAYDAVGILRPDLAPSSIQDGDDFIGRAFVGAERPQVRVLMRQGRSAATEVALDRAAPDPLPERQRKVVAALRSRTIVWDAQRLTALALALDAGGTDRSFDCPGCGSRTSHMRFEHSAFCDRCKVFLLSDRENRVFQHGLSTGTDAWVYFEIDESGAVSPEPIRPSPTAVKPPTDRCTAIIRLGALRVLAVSLSPLAY